MTIRAASANCSAVSVQTWGGGDAPRAKRGALQGIVHPRPRAG